MKNDEQIPQDQQNPQDGQKPQEQPKGFVRNKEDLDLKKQIIDSPESYITPKESDEGLDKLGLKLKLSGSEEDFLKYHVLDIPVHYDSKFFKEWFYVLADLYKVDRSKMDTYVKPKFVAMFIIHFIYARFPYEVLKSLRRKNPLLQPGYSPIRMNKLYECLSPSASEQLDLFIQQCFIMMKESDSVLQFKKNYSQKYHVYYQVELFPEEYN